MRIALVEELEVSSVDDLKYIYGHQELLDMLKERVSPLDYYKFLDAKSLTNPLTKQQLVMSMDSQEQSEQVVEMPMRSALMEHSREVDMDARQLRVSTVKLAMKKLPRKPCALQDITERQQEGVNSKPLHSSLVFLC